MDVIIICKVLGACMVLTALVFVSVMLSAKELRRIDIIEDMIRSFDMISTEIRIGYVNMYEAFLNASNKCKLKEVRSFYRRLYNKLSEEEYNSLGAVWDTYVYECFDNKRLEYEDIRLIREFGLLPTHLDMLIQVRFIDELSDKLRLQSAEYRKRWGQLCRLYRALCVGVGCFIIILLI